MKTFFFLLSLLPLTQGLGATAPYSTTPPTKKPYPYANKKPAQEAPPVEEPVKEPGVDTFSNDSSSFRFTAKHREANGIGYDQGYTSLDAFFTFSSIGNWHPFFDLRTHLFNNGRPAANGGFGVRYLPQTVPVVFGFNGFFDFKNTKDSTFEQVGCGIEVLGARWAMRANGYLPIFTKNNVYSVGFYKFHDHQALFRAKSAFAFKGFDVSLGRTLIKRKLWDLSSTLGGYMFFAPYHKEAAGGLFKIRSNLSFFSFEVQASYDSYFKGIVQVEAAFNLPFGKQVRNKTKGIPKATVNFLANRVTEEVDRFEMIVTSHHSTDSVGRDPRTNEPLYIVFVDNTAHGGHGTAGSPYQSLEQAEHHSRPWDMIYVYGGDGTPRHMNQGIELQEGQWLQGGASRFALRTDFGTCGVPPQSSRRPSIANGEGNTVTVRNNNIVNGFDMRASESNIFGINGHHLTLQNNDFISSFVEDVLLLEPSGTISMEQNHFRSPKGLFLHTSNPIALSIEHNTFSNAVSNLDIDLAGSGHDKVILRDNTFSNSHLASVLLLRGSITSSVLIEKNSFENISALYCLRVTSTASSISKITVQDNLFSSPSRSLLLKADLLSKASWTVLRNTGHYTQTATTTLYPFDFQTGSLATANLTLVGNYASNQGYLLENTGLQASLNVVSPTASILGVEQLNTGNISTEGIIHFVPVLPP